MGEGQLGFKLRLAAQVKEELVVDSKYCSLHPGLPMRVQNVPFATACSGEDLSPCAHALEVGSFLLPQEFPSDETLRVSNVFAFPEDKLWKGQTKHTALLHEVWGKSLPDC